MSTIAAGTRLGPYEILAPIGAGGMGEVWRGRDTRLDRSVAIKVLPADFAQDAQLKLRFEREARAISQLNHPNICTLYDVGDGYLVMELLDGESLADRLGRGAMPLPEVLKYGAQIAEALDKAHRAGIVHRDLKPGNVMITKTGAKLLDFGLAKSNVGLSSLEGATEQRPLTQEGTILGTFQYMAPEQLEGEEADARTDIFALGALLYEMTTGKRAFEGKTRTSLIAAIVQSDPKPISAIQPLTPPSFEHVVQRCLEKDRDDRWQSAHDVAEELKWIGNFGSQTGLRAPVIPRRRSLHTIAWSLPIFLAMAAGWFLARRMMPSHRREVVRFTIPIPESANLRLMAIAPDGKRVAFITQDRDQKQTLWIRSLEVEQPRRLIEVETAQDLFWSPDGRRVAYFTGKQLKSVSIDTAVAETICDTTAGQGTWGSSGTILLSDDGATYRVSERGGEPVLIMKTSSTTLGQRGLAFLPDGRHFLFIRSDAGTDPAAVYVASIDGSDVHRLFTTDRHDVVAYAAPGFITNIAGSKVFARKFDVRNLKISGDPLLVLDGLGTLGGRSISVATAGAVVYRENDVPGSDQVVVLDHKGQTLRALGKPVPIWHIAPSHDNRRLALEIYDAKQGTSDVWTYDIDTGVNARVTLTPKFEWQMTWTPDDSRIIFASNQTDNSDIFSIPASGGEPALVYKNKLFQVPLDVSPDGKFLLFMDSSAGRKFDILALPLGGGQPVPVAATKSNEQAGRFSPDGKWVAFDSDESGESEIYVQRFPQATGKVQVSTGGGITPAWSPDGRELYYRTRDDDLLAVPVAHTADELRFGKPEILFRVDRLGGRSFGRYKYAPGRNGEFYVARTVAEGVQSPMHVVLNATAALDEGVSPPR